MAVTRDRREGRLHGLLFAISARTWTFPMQRDSQGATHLPGVQAIPPPAGTRLQHYAASGAYADCYAATIEGEVSLAAFMAAFYTTPIFKLERWLLARFLHVPSTDREAQLLAQGSLTRFSAWTVEHRESHQATLAAGRTRAGLMVASGPAGAGKTTLFFGSAIAPRKRGDLGWQFQALLPFHKAYSRILLAWAIRRLARDGA
jgi:hypothetical protein